MSPATAAKKQNTGKQKNVENVEKPKYVERPEKPDEGKFTEERNALDDELQEIREQLKAVQDKLSLAEAARSKDFSAPGQSPVQRKQSALRAELKIHDQIKQIDTSLKAKITEQNAAMAKVNYKNVAEIDAAIAELDAQVESDTMKIVDELRALADISSLRRHRNTFEGAQKAIDLDQAKIAELKAQLGENPEQKKLSDRYSEIIAELDSIKAEQDEFYNNLRNLRDERTRLKGLDREKFEAKKKLEREFYAAEDAYRQLEREFYAAKDAYRQYEKAARRERQRAEREAKEKEYKRHVAAQMMEEASLPAFASEILTCEGLIAHFDPTSPEALAAKNKSSLLKDAGLKASATRVVASLPEGKKLFKEEEDYFVGKSKKGKKGSNKGSGAATPTAAAPQGEDKAGEKGKFHLNHGILSELGKVDVRAPIGWDDVPACVEKLRERLSWYRENSERMTKENIAKAQEKIDLLEGVNQDPVAPMVEETSVPDPVDEEEEEEQALPVPATIEQPKEGVTTEETTEDSKTE